MPYYLSHLSTLPRDKAQSTFIAGPSIYIFGLLIAISLGTRVGDPFAVLKKLFLKTLVTLSVKHRDYFSLTNKKIKKLCSHPKNEIKKSRCGDMSGLVLRVILILPILHTPNIYINLIALNKLWDLLKKTLVIFKYNL